MLCCAMQKDRRPINPGAPGRGIVRKIKSNKRKYAVGIVTFWRKYAKKVWFVVVGD